MSVEIAALLDRVDKLLRLATSSNVHEAAQAMARAQELIARHRLEDAIKTAAEAPPVVDARDNPLDASRRLRDWKIALATVLARANGAACYVLERGSGKTGMRELILVGEPDDVAAVRALYRWYVPRMEALTLQHAPVGDGRPVDRDWARGFRFGAVDALARALYEATAAVYAEPGLVPARSVAPHTARAAAADRAIAALGTTRAKGVRVHARAYQAGLDAGGALPRPPD
jgi:hypothetical protein